MTLAFHFASTIKPVPLVLPFVPLLKSTVNPGSRAWEPASISAVELHAYHTCLSQKINRFVGTIFGVNGPLVQECCSIVVFRTRKSIIESVFHIYYVKTFITFFLSLLCLLCFFNKKNYLIDSRSFFKSIFVTWQTVDLCVPSQPVLYYSLSITFSSVLRRHIGRYDSGSPEFFSDLYGV